VVEGAEADEVVADSEEETAEAVVVVSTEDEEAAAAEEVVAVDGSFQYLTRTKTFKEMYNSHFVQIQIVCKQSLIWVLFADHQIEYFTLNATKINFLKKYTDVFF